VFQYLNSEFLYFLVLITGRNDFHRLVRSRPLNWQALNTWNNNNTCLMATLQDSLGKPVRECQNIFSFSAARDDGVSGYSQNSNMSSEINIVDSLVQGLRRAYQNSKR